MRNPLANATFDSVSGIRLEPNISRHSSRRASEPRKDLSGATVSFADYVEQRFIPNHVSLKTDAGRMHYQAILKHVLTPEAVERMFAPNSEVSKSRLKTLPDWPYLDHVRLCDLKADHVRHLTVSASARGYSPQTIKHIRNVVGKVIFHARKEGYFSGENPVSEIKLPAILQRKVHKLTITEAKAVLRLMQCPEREIALIAMTTGMGVSEICVLRWKDINLTDTAVYCDGEVIPPRHALVKRQPKDAHSVSPATARMRIVEIPEPLVRRLQRLRRELRQSEPETLLLKHLGGNPLRPGGICSRLQHIGKEVGIPWLSWPALKRAHQTLLSDLRAQLSDELMVGVR
jgi:integrase